MPLCAAPLARTVLAGMAMAVLAGCDRADEAAMRARLKAWFSIAETRYFAARPGCAAGLFGLVDDSVKAAMPVAGTVPGMLRTIERRGRAALDDRRQPPDAALVALANADRATGYALRRVGLQGRDCMDADTMAAFGAALRSKAAILAYDAETGMMILVDRDAGRVLATMGRATWW